jgi:glycerate 2-kinase
VDIDLEKFFDKVNHDRKLPQLQKCFSSIASDVTNPFYGEKGEAHIFAGQKGASSEEIVKLDESFEGAGSFV